MNVYISWVLYVVIKWLRLVLKGVYNNARGYVRTASPIVRSHVPDRNIHGYNMTLSIPPDEHQLYALRMRIARLNWERRRVVFPLWRTMAPINDGHYDSTMLVIKTPGAHGAVSATKTLGAFNIRYDLTATNLDPNSSTDFIDNLDIF